MMRWNNDGPCAYKREDSRYRIYRSPQEGFVPPDGTVIFVLVEGSRRIGGLRNIENTGDAMRRALKQLQDQANARP